MSSLSCASPPTAATSVRPATRTSSLSTAVRMTRAAVATRTSRTGAPAATATRRTARTQLPRRCAGPGRASATDRRLVARGARYDILEHPGRDARLRRAWTPGAGGQYRLRNLPQRAPGGCRRQARSPQGAAPAASGVRGATLRRLSRPRRAVQVQVLPLGGEPALTGVLAGSRADGELGDSDPNSNQANRSVRHLSIHELGSLSPNSPNWCDDFR
jgi:hypothetical protein